MDPGRVHPPGTSLRGLSTYMVNDLHIRHLLAYQMYSIDIPNNAT